MDDWESQKNRRNLRRLNRRSPPSQDDTGDDSSDSSPLHAETAHIYVELQSKSDFLKSRPDINPAETGAFTSSQLSQFPHSDPDIQLPPSQFFIVSSQPSQDIAIADSQPLSTFLCTQSQQASSCVKAQGLSQTTIPDSQDFSTDFSQDQIEVPCTIQDIDATETGGARASPRTASASSIPSRQPDGNLVSFGTFSISTGLEHNRESQDSVTAPQLVSNLVPPSDSESSRVPFSGFLTQLEFDSGESSLSAKPHQASQPDEAAATTNDCLGTITIQDTALLDDSHQPAQRVPPLHQESQFLTQSEPAFLSVSEEYDFVPPTSQRESGTSEQHPVPSQHAILPATRGRGPLHPPIVSLCYTT